MALPSTRRPQFVEEELIAEVQKLPKMKLTKPGIFMKAMVDWFTFLRPRQQDKITPMDLKRRAIHELFKLQYEYDRLPRNWVKSFMDETGMEFYDKEKYKAKYPNAKERSRSRSKSKTPKKAKKPRKNAKEPEEKSRMQPVRAAAVLAIAAIADQQQDKGGKIIGNAARAEGQDAVDGSGSGPGTSASARASASGGAKTPRPAPDPLRKKTIDLSNEPPPAWWTKAYADGVHLRRELTVYSGDGVNVIFYDYKPNLQIDEKYKDFKPMVHEANGFDWFEELGAKIPRDD